MDYCTSILQNELKCMSCKVEDGIRHRLKY